MNPAAVVSSHLLRICRSIPLVALSQGASLTIQSVLPQTQFIIRPEWRNDGHLTLEQQHPNDEEADMIVQQEDNMVTSLGRSETHISVRLQPRKVHPYNRSSESTKSTTIQHSAYPTKHGVEELSNSNSGKVMLDDGTILPDSVKWNPPPEGMTRVEYHDGVAHIKAKNANHDESDRNHPPSVSLTVNIPEKLNLTCKANQGGSIVMNHKVEGDSRLVTTDGDIRVKKLRGHQVVLETKALGSVIHASDLLEAEHLQVSTRGRFRAQRIQGDHVNIVVNHSLVGEGNDETDHDGLATRHDDKILDDNDEGAIIDVSALYTSGDGGANLSVTSNSTTSRLVSVKSNHGHIHVEATATLTSNATTASSNSVSIGPLVHLGGINGSCNVSIGALGNPFESLLAGRIHIDSLSPNSVSIITATQGDIMLSLDQNVNAELRLLSAVNAESLPKLSLLSEKPADRVGALQSLDQQLTSETSRDRIHVDLKSFVKSAIEIALHNCEYVEGWLRAKPSRTRSGGGKIRLDAAASQALHEFDPARKGTEESNSPPLLVVITNGRIEMEALSWKESIARKFGFEKRA